MANWLTKDDKGNPIIGVTWPDSDDLEEDVLGVYLGAAKDACIAYAPAQTNPDNIPDGYVLAQIMQARNIYNAGGAPINDGDPSGASYGISSFPLDWQVRQLLRPQTGIGHVL